MLGILRDPLSSQKEYIKYQIQEEIHCSDVTLARHQIKKIIREGSLQTSHVLPIKDWRTHKSKQKVIKEKAKQNEPKNTIYNYNKILQKHKLCHRYPKTLKCCCVTRPWEKACKDLCPEVANPVPELDYLPKNDILANLRNQNQKHILGSTHIHIYILLLCITNIEDGSDKQRDVNNAAHRKMRLEWGFVLLFLLSALR